MNVWIMEIISLLKLNNIPLISIAERYQGIKDIEVLEITVENKAFLLTEDKDFGELIFRLGHTHYGVLLIRFPNNYDQDLKALKVIKVVLEKFEEIENCFSVLDENKLRVKK